MNPGIIIRKAAANLGKPRPYVIFRQRLREAVTGREMVFGGQDDKPARAVVASAVRVNTSWQGPLNMRIEGDGDPAVLRNIGIEDGEW